MTGRHADHRAEIDEDPPTWELDRFPSYRVMEQPMLAWSDAGIMGER